MTYFLLMLCAFAEGFLLWVLVALIREGRRRSPLIRKDYRGRRGPVSRRGELIPMNPGTMQDENMDNTIGKRNGVMALGALLLMLVK